MSDLLDSLAAIRTKADIAPTLAKLAKPYDVVFVSVRTFDAQGTIEGHTTMPTAWVDHYRERQYDKLDPGLQTARSLAGTGGNSFEAPAPGEVWDKSMALMNHEIRDLHVAGSFFATQPTAQLGTACMVNFITDASGHSYKKWIKENGPKLQLLAAAASVGIADQFEPLPSPVELSQREKDALRWLAQGHRVDRIAEKMGLSNRTVEVHLARARARLGANTREQALVTAIRTGLLE